MACRTPFGIIEWVGLPEVLWRYRPDSGLEALDVVPPVLPVDGVPVRLTGAGEPTSLGAPTSQTPSIEWIVDAPVEGHAPLMLRTVFRIAEATPVIRFRYEMWAAPSAFRPPVLSSLVDAPEVRYLALSTAAFPHAREVRLADFNEVLHSYQPVETPLTGRHFEAGFRAEGPMIVATDDTQFRLVAYEHGSPAGEAFLAYDLSADRTITLRPVKGNWPVGRSLSAEDPFASPWFDLMAAPGGLDAAASSWRRFVLRQMADHAASRAPLIFYNTWANQERSKWWRGKPYLEPMHEARMLEEIDIAHQMGIEVFVLDTGWYEKTGDWKVSPSRFPRGLAPIRARLDQYGMKLGLWFNPLAAACSSDMLARHADCVRSWRDVPSAPAPVWETEDSVSLCLVSRYRDAFADRLIQLALEEGVRYFKWDAIDLYGCDAPGHFHGDAGNTPQERADCHAFELVRSMVHVVERLQQACPDAIVDFDVTEGGRAFGLGFLSAGKYFLINNGPYFQNYDVPIDPVRNNWNLFFQPGHARNRMLRMCLALDRWLPSVLFLAHALPDDPEENQWDSLATLMLGFNGIWGDLAAVSPEGVARHARVLGLYRQVRAAVAAADPVREGQVGGSPEINEKIDATSGCGVVCLFSAARIETVWITTRAVSPEWSVEGDADLSVERLADGCARIHARFSGAGAGMVFFGAS